MRKHVLIALLAWAAAASPALAADIWRDPTATFTLTIDRAVWEDAFPSPGKLDLSLLQAARVVQCDANQETSSQDVTQSQLNAALRTRTREQLEAKMPGEMIEEFSFSDKDGVSILREVTQRRQAPEFLTIQLTFMTKGGPGYAATRVRCMGYPPVADADRAKIEALLATIAFAK